MTDGNEPVAPGNRVSMAGFLADNVLRPDESNFPDLLEMMTWLGAELRQDARGRPGRRPLADSAFSYPDELPRVPFPENPQTFETAARHSLEGFQGLIRWHHPHALFNITAAPLLDTVALTALTALHNPNALWDTTSGKFLLLERRVIAYLNGLAGWPAEAGGLFTFGGKATLMYAVKCGLNRCDPAATMRGLRGSYTVLASENAHFSVESVCNYSGLGHDSCRRVAVDRSGTIDLAALEREVREVLGRGDRIACCILSGGGTMNLRIDPVNAVRELLERCSAEYSVHYTPHIHLDSVITWPWLMFAEDAPELTDPAIPPAVRRQLGEAVQRIHEARSADSFAADFHKTGLSPYASSCFLSRSGQALLDVDRTPDNPTQPENRYGDISNFDRTFENSRSCTGIISAYQVLHRLGRAGMRGYLIHLLSNAQRLRDTIRESFAGPFEILNEATLGFEVVVHADLFGDGTTLKVIENGDAELRSEYSTRAAAFREWLLHSQYCNTNGVPFIGYVARYTDHNHRCGLPAFLLYPTSVHFGPDESRDALARLTEALNRFRNDPGAAASTRIDWQARPHPPK